MPLLNKAIHCVLHRKHAEGMSLRYDESLNLTPFFKTQDTQLTAVPQKRLLFYLPLQFWQVIFKIICQN